MGDISRPSPSTTTKGETRISTVHVGDRLCLSEVHTMRCMFHEFESLPHEAGKVVWSEEMRIHGHQWRLKLYPGGQTKESSGDVSSERHLSLYLYMKPKSKNDKVLASYQFRVPGVRTVKYGGDKRIFSEAWGFEDFITRKNVLDSSKNYLKDGTLTIETDIQVWTKQPKCWSPPVKGTFRNDMLSVLEKARFADVTFVVRDKKFPVHRAVIASRAPVLAAFFEDEPSNSEIEINGSIDPAIFELLLRFVYGGSLPPLVDYSPDQARAMLYAANYCGLTAPKLAAESSLIETIAADTAADLLTFADANSCALLKEMAIDFFVANPAAVRASASWANVKESKDLMDELMESMYEVKRDPSEELDPDKMCVITLRRKLGESGLDVDGSRTSLVKRLKNSRAAE